MIERADTPLPILTEVAVSAARAGGSALLEQRRTGYRVQFKGEIDLVTDADRRSERTVVSILQSHFPDHQILAEEGSTGGSSPVSYTHLRAHETDSYLVCRLLL